MIDSPHVNRKRNSPNVCQILDDHHDQAKHGVVKQKGAHECHGDGDDHDDRGDDAAFVGHLPAREVSAQLPPSKTAWSRLTFSNCFLGPLQKDFDPLD